MNRILIVEDEKSIADMGKMDTYVKSHLME